MQLPPGQSMPLVYDPGLMNAVTNAQNFVNQTFSGARLLESHNVSSTEVKHRALVWGSILAGRTPLSRITESFMQTRAAGVLINVLYCGFTCVLVG